MVAPLSCKGGVQSTGSSVHLALNIIC